MEYNSSSGGEEGDGEADNIIVEYSTLSESSLAQIDWEQLSNSINNSFWKLSTMKSLETIYNTIVDNPESPDIDRIRHWLPIANVVVDSKSSILLAAQRRGNPIFAFKLSKNISIGNTAFAILKLLNSLREKIVQFPYIFGIVHTAKPIHDGQVALSWMVKSIYEPTDLIVMEYYGSNLRTLDVFIRETGSDTSIYMYLNIFMQILLSMKLANITHGFIHHNLVCEHILLDTTTLSNTKTWIPVADEWILSDVIVRICGLSKCSAILGEDRIFSDSSESSKRYPIYDIYTLILSFLYNMCMKRSPSPHVKGVINILTDLALALEIPTYAINSVRSLRLSDDLLYSKLDDNILETSYTQCVVELMTLLRRRDIDIDNFYKQSLQTTDTIPKLNFSDNFEISYNINYNDGYIKLIAESKQIDDDIDNNKYTIYFDASVKSLLENVEMGFVDANKHINELGNICAADTLLYSTEKLEDLIILYKTIFEDLLSIKIFIDDLKVKLRYRTELFDDQININLANYIKEKDAKLMRIVGENEIIYKRAYLIVDYDTMQQIKNIWIILHDKNVKLR